MDLVWSEDGAGWSAYDITSQHTTILLNSSGAVVKEWRAFDGEAILKELA